MRPQPSLFVIALVVLGAALSGCTDGTVELKQKVAELENKIDKQQKDFAEFVGRFAPQKDFSADIQRIEDQQDRVSQIFKTQVEPINSRLEEFRDWAQEAQKEREEVRQRIKALGQSVAEMEKSIPALKKEVEHLVKNSAVTNKRVKIIARHTENVTKEFQQVRKEVLDNNKLFAEVKKTLPKVRDSAVAKLIGRLEPLEKQVASLTAALNADRKTMDALRTQKPVAGGGKDVQILTRRIAELEEILESQKAFLLELGAKVHQMETQYR
jgi:chromosome segregation ATPase